MNHYDDLQRFKEKTRTHSLQFKDLSSEAAAGEKGDWAILNQLVPVDVETESALAIGGVFSLPLPQPVPADMFSRVENAPVQDLSLAVAPVVTIPEPESVSAPVAPVAIEPAVQESAAIVKPERQQSPPSAPAPLIRPRPAITPAAEGFGHLFAAKTVEPEPLAKDKDQSLKSLLERIATCR